MGFSLKHFSMKFLWKIFDNISQTQNFLCFWSWRVWSFEVSESKKIWKKILANVWVNFLYKEIQGEEKAWDKSLIFIVQKLLSETFSQRKFRGLKNPKRVFLINKLNFTRIIHQYSDKGDRAFPAELIDTLYDTFRL